MQVLDLTLDWAISAAAGRRRVRYFCPIWYDTTTGGQLWWMTFNRRTYCHDLLEVCGGDNLFTDRERRYPLAADLGRTAPRRLTGRHTRSAPHAGGDCGGRAGSDSPTR